MWTKMWIAVFLAPALPVGCGGPVHSQAPVAQAQPQEKAAPPTPLAKEKAELGDDQTWKPDWDKIVEDALPLIFCRQRSPRTLKLSVRGSIRLQLRISVPTGPTSFRRSLGQKRD